MADDRLAELETENAHIDELRRLYHQSRLRYDVAYKQSTKSFLTETIDAKDTARDMITLVVEWVARYWMKLPDDADAVRGRRIYQPFKDFDYRRDEALMAQNAKWNNIAQVYAQADRQADLQAMGLAALVQKANTLTAEIQQLTQYVNALLVISPDAAVEQTAQYIQQDLNKVEAQYQQSRKHKKGDDDSDVTPAVPE